MAAIRARLKKLPHSELRVAAKSAGIGFSSAWRMREGQTPNPGIETVRRLLSAIK
jgi:hypothetical protein